MMETIVAFDQSYTRTGISVITDGVPVKCYAIDFKGIKNRHEKRRILFTTTLTLIADYQPSCIVVERVRLFSRGVVSMASIIALANCIAVIVDAAALQHVAVYSVDTRAWKSVVLKNPSATKADAVAFAKTFGFDVNDDAADALCIGLYNFIAHPSKLKLED